MRLPESTASPMIPEKLARLELDLPSFPIVAEPLGEHAPVKMTWAEPMRYLEPLRKYYMEDYDSPERRLANKNPERFRMD